MMENVGVGEEEPTKNYIKLVFAPQLGQGIMSNTVRVKSANVIVEIEWEH